jgi:hypothetical protein
MPDHKATLKSPTARDRSVDVDPFFVMNRRAFATWAQGMSKLSQEMAQLMQARLQQEAEMWGKLAACRDPADLVQCQSEFATKIGTDYAEAAQKLSRLMLDFANGYASDLMRPPTETD